MKPITIPMTTQQLQGLLKTVPGKQPELQDDSVLICVRARSKKTGESIAVIAAERESRDTVIWTVTLADPRLVSIKGA